MPFCRAELVSQKCDVQANSNEAMMTHSKELVRPNPTDGFLMGKRDGEEQERDDSKEPFIKRMRAKYEEAERSGTAGSSKDQKADIEDVEEESEEAVAPKGFPSPTIPTRSEREEHEKTHVQFRSWCKHCVCGRGMSSPHRDVSSSRKSHLHPTIAMDYCFPKDFDGNCPTCLECTYAMGVKKAIVIPQKGGGK